MNAPREAERGVPAGEESDHSGEVVLFEGRRALVPSVSVLLLAILTLGLWLLPRWWHRGSKLYRITTRRIVVETGVLSKRLEQIDLYRIADYTVDRPFLQRVLGTGNLLLKTFDKSTPELDVREIKTDVVALYEKLRVATEAEKAKRGVRMVDYESRT
ncbi:MAG TPA: PH domain-containing protein [Polyangiaceae bacterium]|nr:PH domain-containing protein [Polyangiaceae bacterium]